MIEDEKMQVAVFRFSVIGDFVNGTQMGRSEKRRLMREKCARKWQIPFSEKTRISKGTIQRWCRVYRDSRGDLKSLYPQNRSDLGKARAMDEETCHRCTRCLFFRGNKHRQVPCTKRKPCFNQGEQPRNSTE